MGRRNVKITLDESKSNQQTEEARVALQSYDQPFPLDQKQTAWVVPIIWIFSTNPKHDQPSQASTYQRNPSYKNGTSRNEYTA